MVLARQMVHREAPGHGLLVEWVRLLRSVRLASVATRFGADDELGARQRQQIAELNGIDDIRRREHHPTIGPAISHGDGADPIAGYDRSDGLVLE